MSCLYRLNRLYRNNTLISFLGVIRKVKGENQEVKAWFHINIKTKWWLVLLLNLILKNIKILSLTGLPREPGGPTKPRGPGSPWKADFRCLLSKAMAKHSKTVGHGALCVGWMGGELRDDLAQLSYFMEEKTLWKRASIQISEFWVHKITTFDITFSPVGPEGPGGPKGPGRPCQWT